MRELARGLRSWYEDSVTGQKKPKGRPEGTSAFPIEEGFRAELQAACTSLRSAAGGRRPMDFQTLVAKRMGVSVDTLERHLEKFGMSWEEEAARSN